MMLMIFGGEQPNGAAQATPSQVPGAACEKHARPIADETPTIHSNDPAVSNRAEAAPVSTYNLMVTVLLSV